MALEDRVADYIGANNIPATVDLDAALQDATVKHLRILSPQQQRKYATEKAVADPGGLDISDSVLVEANKSGYPSIMFSANWKGRLSDSDSIYEATDQSPAHYFEDNKVFVVPGGGSALVIDYPTIDSTTDTSIGVLPDDLEVATIILTAIHVLNRDITDDLSNVATSLNLPAAPTLTSYPTAPTLPTPPTYSDPTKPDLTTNYSDLDTRISDDDVEVAGVIIQEIQTQLAEYQRDVEEAIGEYNADVSNYQTELSGDLEVYSSEVQQIASENSELLQQYQTDTQAEISRVQTVAQAITAVTETKFKQIQTLQALYQQYLQPYMSEAPNDATGNGRIATT